MGEAENQRESDKVPNHKKAKSVRYKRRKRERGLCMYCTQPRIPESEKYCITHFEKYGNGAAKIYNPTPEEIKRMTQEIRDGWSDLDRSTRTATEKPVDMEHIHHIRIEE